MSFGDDTLDPANHERWALEKRYDDAVSRVKELEGQIEVMRAAAADARPIKLCGGGPYRVVENGINHPQGSAHLIMCGKRPAASVPNIAEAHLFANAWELLVALQPLANLSVNSDVPDDFVVLDLAWVVGAGKIRAGDIKRARAVVNTLEKIGAIKTPQPW